MPGVKRAKSRLSLPQIATVYGVSHQRVQQIEATAVAKFCGGLWSLLVSSQEVRDERECWECGDYGWVMCGDSLERCPACEFRRGDDGPTLFG